MSKSLRLITAVTTLFALIASAKAEDTIRFATEGAYPPFNERGADGSLIGFEIDLGQALCARIKRQCEFIAQDWDGMIPGLLAHRFDGIFASMLITEERKKQIDFTNRYYQSNFAFVARKGTRLSLDDKKLDGKVIGTIPGSSVCYLEKKFPEATVKVYDSADSMYLDLVSGRIDAITAATVVDTRFLKSEQGKDMAFVSENFVDPDCFGAGYGIGLRKEDTALREDLNRAIAEVRADGTYSEIAKKYFDYDIYGN